MKIAATCGMVYYILMKFLVHRTEGFVEAEALAVGVFISTLSEARAKLPGRKHSAGTGGKSYGSFARFIDLSNTYTTASRLLSLTIILGLISAFYDLTAIIMIFSHDVEHSSLLTLLMGVFFSAITVFAAYLLCRKRHENKSY